MNKFKIKRYTKSNSPEWNGPIEKNHYFKKGQNVLN